MPEEFHPLALLSHLTELPFAESPFQLQDFLLLHPLAKEKEPNELIAGPNGGIHTFELFAIDL